VFKKATLKVVGIMEMQKKEKKKMKNVCSTLGRYAYYYFEKK